MQKMDVFYTLSALITCTISLTTAADVTINLRYEAANIVNRGYIEFSSENFGKLYECMCHNATRVCIANYKTDRTPYLEVTDVENEMGQPNTHYFECTNRASGNSMICNQWSSEPNKNYNYTQSFRMTSLLCNSSCVTLVWTHKDETMTVAHLNDFEFCDSGTVPAPPTGSVTATTRPSTTAPNHTNSTRSDDDNDSSTGVIVGVVVAIIIIIVIVAVVVGIIFWRRRRPPPKRQSWPNLEANSNNTTSLDDALNYRYRQHPAAAQEDTSNNNLHYGNGSNLQANHSSTDAVKKSNGIVEKHDYTEVDVTSKRGNNIVKGNISASGYDFADVPEEDKPQAKDGGKRVALVPGNKKKADDNGTGEDSDYSVIDDSEDKARQDSRGGSTAAGSTSLYSTAKTDDDFGYSTVKDNNQGKPPANLNNTNKSQDNISTPQNTAYSLAGNTENTISKDSNSTTPHIYSTFNDDSSKPQNPYNVLPDADQDQQSEPPLSIPSSNPTNPNIQPSRYSMANPMLDASFDKTAGNSIEIITLPSSATK